MENAMAFVVGAALPISIASQNAFTCARRRPSALVMNTEPTKKDGAKAGGDKRPAQGSSFKPRQGGSGSRSMGGNKSNAPAAAKKADSSAATSTSSEGPLRFAKDMKQKPVWGIRVANIKDVNALCGMLHEPYNNRSVVEGMVKTGVVVLAEFSVLPPLNTKAATMNANNPTSSTAAFARAAKPAAAPATDDTAATSAPAAAATAASTSSISKKVLAAVLCSVSGAARDPSVGVSSGVVKRGQLLAVYSNPQVPEDSQALSKLVLAAGKLLQDNQGISLAAKSTKAMSISAEHLEKLGFVNHGTDGFILDLEARTMDPGKKIQTE